MAKYIPIDTIKSMSGKVCEHSDIYFAKKGNTLYTGKRCNPRDLDKKPYSEAELARQTKFTQVREAIKALTPEDKAAYAEAFAKNPGKYSTLNGYIFAKEYEKLS
jgi:hypothetical protein